MVALSESFKKICLKRPLVVNSRWRHIRLAIKERYLGTHASQIQSYYGTLWGSHARCFRIHHEKLRETPPGGKIMMTSCTPCNKTSLSRKTSIPNKKFVWNTISKSWSHFQNSSWKIAVISPGVEITMTSYPACNKSTLSQKPCICR